MHGKRLSRKPVDDSRAPVGSAQWRCNGTLWTFGCNTEGELGRPDNSGTDNPNPTPTSVVMTDVSVIAAGASHSLALKGNGTLWAFGLNQDGQLGDPATAGDITPNPTPVQVLSTFAIATIAADGYHSIALKTDGTLWTIGFNFDGELGRSANIDSFDPNPTPTQVLTDVEKIGAGAYHTLVMTEFGELQTFGYNFYGQLGVGTNSGEDLANPNPMTVIPPEFRPLVPARLLDSRSPGGTTVDGVSRAIGIRAANSTTQLQVTGRGGVAPVAGAAVLNITVTGAQSGGYITAYPCGGPLPNASNLNYLTGNTIPNLVISQVDVGGKVCLFTSAATNLIVDVTGFYPILPTFESLVPARLMDTRSPGSATIDHQFEGIGSRAAGSTTQLQVTDRGGVPADGGSAVLNITVTAAAGAGYITVWPCGSPQPNASNLNYVVGSTIANLVISQIGTGGKVCIFTSAATHLIADVDGYYAA